MSPFVVCFRIPPWPSNPDIADAEQPRFKLRQRLQITLVRGSSPHLWADRATLRNTNLGRRRDPAASKTCYPGIYPFWHRCVFPAEVDLPSAATGGDDQPQPRRRIHCAGHSPLRIRAGARLQLARRTARVARDEQTCMAEERRGVHHRWAARAALRRQTRTGTAGAHERRSHHRLLRCGGKSWVLKLLGRLVIPKPFSRVYVRFAKKIWVPPTPTTRHGALSRRNAGGAGADDGVRRVAIFLTRD